MKKNIILGTIGYTIGTFVLAIVWHIVLFESQYKAFGYIESEPNFALGFTSILLQGLILSAFYAHLRKKCDIPALKYACMMGLFFWTSHVLAFVAKQDVENAWLFVAMETFYLMLQFGLYGLILKHLYKKS